MGKTIGLTKKVVEERKKAAAEKAKAEKAKGKSEEGKADGKSE